jgi:hypothetical protein
MWNQKSTKHLEKGNLRGSQSQGPLLLRIEPKKPSSSSSSFLAHVIWYVESIERQNDLLMDGTISQIRAEASRWMRRNQHTSSDVSCLVSRWPFGILISFVPYLLFFVFDYQLKFPTRLDGNFDSSRSCWGHNTPSEPLHFQLALHLVKERVPLPLDATGSTVNDSLDVDLKFRVLGSRQAHPLLNHMTIFSFLLWFHRSRAPWSTVVYIPPKCYITNNELFVSYQHLYTYPWKNTKSRDYNDPPEAKSYPKPL